MIAESFRNSSNFIKFIFTLFIIISGFVIFMVLGTLIAIPIFNIDVTALSEALDPSKTENVPLLKFLQSFYSTGLFIAPPLVAAYFFSGSVKEYLGLSKPPKILLIIIAIATVVFGTPLINFLMELNQDIHFPEGMSGFEDIMKQFENEAQTTTNAFLETNSFGNYLVNLLVIAAIPAIGEELMFRGVFQRIFHDWSKNIHLAIWLSAFMFSAMHAQFYGLIPRMVLGALFGYFYYWSKNMWLPILAHFSNNAFAVTAYYLNGTIAQNAEDIGTGENALHPLALSLILVSGLLIAFYKLEKVKTEGITKETENKNLSPD